jgi:hypothetical protein
MSLETDLQALSNHEHFARFLQVEQLQQISGRILTYDQILQMCDWRNLRTKFSDRI